MESHLFHTCILWQVAFYWLYLYTNRGWIPATCSLMDSVIEFDSFDYLEPLYPFHPFFLSFAQGKKKKWTEEGLKIFISYLHTPYYIRNFQKWLSHSFPTVLNQCSINTTPHLKWNIYIKWLRKCIDIQVFRKLFKYWRRIFFFLEV